MEHDAIRSVRCGDKNTDEGFMHLVIESVVQKCLRDLIVEMHPPRFQHLLFETRNERKERLFIPLLHLAQFFRLNFHRLRVIVNQN